MKKVIICTLVVAFAVSMLLVGTSCGGGVKAEKAGFKVGLDLPTMNVFWLPLQAAVEEKVKAAGGTVIVTTSQGYKAQIEIANIEDMLQQKIDVLIMSPADQQASIPAVESANKKNVPVICLDSGTLGGKLVTTVSTQNYNAGVMVAEYIIKQIGGKGKVGIIDGPPVAAVRDRIKGYEDTIAKYPDVKIVAKQLMGNTLAEGVTVAENILQANPDLNAFLGMNDFSFLGALTAIQSAGKVGQIAIGGVDGMPDVCTILASGLAPMCCTAGQQPAEMGRQGVQAYLDLVAGKTVPELIPIEPVLITKENAAGFHW